MGIVNNLYGPEGSLDVKIRMSPVMAGGLFAVDRRWFWELGGYDPGLEIWGGEQYEISFKVWMCGGEMFDVPCSRVGHIYRKYVPYKVPSGTSLARNLKRVAETWMDEFAEYIYQRRPEYRHLSTGDISAQKELRKQLKCKDFKWFMAAVAWDVPKYYPPVEPPPAAWGEKAYSLTPNSVGLLCYCNQFFGKLNKLLANSANFSGSKESCQMYKHTELFYLHPGGVSAPTTHSPYKVHLFGKLVQENSNQAQWLILMDCQADVPKYSALSSKGEGGETPKIRNVAANLCIDSKHGATGTELRLDICVKDGSERTWSHEQACEVMLFTFGWREDIRPGEPLHTRKFCFDAISHNSPVTLYDCHGMKGNQLWGYRKDRTLFHPVSNSCMDSNPAEKKIFMARCDPLSETQQWIFEHINMTVLEKFSYHVSS
ncbi:Polypeptide N-acetylgalactosaminyltransferase-like 6 [Fukomys damarensis]|uniref:polypeptide N-acetylgalactosaminyltransferase n=1 Tax=Fukomys damarensis TaxID=885580 RepID=A0A091E6V7_FUKDA|nr:Polypeptide N-acetylgalactosaminyltransferase-like 6 [Fukomys damarensis]